MPFRRNQDSACGRGAALGDGRYCMAIHDVFKEAEQLAPERAIRVDCRTADLDAWAWELKFDGYGLPACGAGFAWAKALKPGRRIWWYRPATTVAAWHGCLCAAGLASSVHWTVPMVGERLATGNVPWECHDKPTASLGEATKQPVFQPRQEGWLGSYGRSRVRLTCSGTPMVEAGGSRPTPHERRANEREIQGCFTR